MSRIIAAILLCLVVCINPAWAEVEDELDACAKVRDSADRLQCYNEAIERKSECLAIVAANKRLNCFDAMEEARGVSLPQDAERDLTPMEARMFSEKLLWKAETGRWSITPHFPTYIMPYSYNFDGVNTAPFEEAFGEGIQDQDPEDLKDSEAKFQISFKIPLWPNMFDSKSHLFFGYTQLSAWQIYTDTVSAPFRDNNYQPELIWALEMNRKLGPLEWEFFTVSLNHQSNGRAEPLSRSWNRIIFNFLASNGNWLFHLRPWYRIPEDDEDDNNPDIEDYVGYGELWTYYKFRRHTFGMMLMNNFDFDDNKTTVQLDWSFPIHSKLQGYVQYYNGYKETLIDYDYRNQKLGVGVMLTNIF